MAHISALGSHEFGFVLIGIYIWYELLRRYKRFGIILVMLSLVIAYGVYHLVFFLVRHILTTGGIIGIG